MGKNVFLFIGLFCSILCFGSLNEARAADDCVEEAQKMKLVSINYNNGSLMLDNTQPIEMVGKICGDTHAAGCFKFSIKYSQRVDSAFKRVGKHICLIPHITVDYDFSGSTVYIAKEYKDCKARALMRHELQHFTIWKTATEKMLDEVGNGLRKMVLQYVELCNEKKKCKINLQEKTWEYTQKITKKWENISTINNNRLDSIDHQEKSEFAYRACSSWPY